MKPLSFQTTKLILEAILIYLPLAYLSYLNLGIVPVYIYTIILITAFLCLPRFKRQETIYFTKLHHNAKIPSKRYEDAGLDIYPCFEEDYIEIKPHETKMIPTGIASKFDERYAIILKERGSTGTKGIAQRAGVIDSGFRGEWMIPITNTNNVPLYISKDERLVAKTDVGDAIVYPYKKAICQALIVDSKNLYIKRVTNKEYSEFKSERMDGMLGSSGK